MSGLEWDCWGSSFTNMHRSYIFFLENPESKKAQQHLNMAAIFNNILKSEKYWTISVSLCFYSYSLFPTKQPRPYRGWDDRNEWGALTCCKSLLLNGVGEHFPKSSDQDFRTSSLTLKDTCFYRVRRRRMWMRHRDRECVCLHMCVCVNVCVCVWEGEGVGGVIVQCSDNHLGHKLFCRLNSFSTRRHHVSIKL